MKMRTKELIFLLLKQQRYNICALIVCVFIGVFSSGRISFNNLKDVLTTLQSISAAIFTIIGLWVGFLYPNAMKSIVDDNVSYIKNENDAPRIERLIYVIITSALVMLGTLVVYLFKLILPAVGIYYEFASFFKVFCISLVLFMCWMQSMCVISVVISNLRFVNNLHGKVNTAKLEHHDD